MKKGTAVRSSDVAGRLAIFLSAILLGSCATSQRHAAYEPPPREGAAFLVSEDNLNPARMFLIGGVSIYAAVVDRAPIRGARDRGSDPLPVRPGLRQVLVARFSGDGTGLVPIELEAQSGETYFVRHEVEKVAGIASIFDIGRWFFWIEDRSGKRVTQPVEMAVQRNRQPFAMPIIVPKGR